MDMEQNENISQEETGYTPRPAWQVWLARIGLVAFILFLLFYYVTLFGGGA
ncbi:MAG: hypothetical protein IJB17_01180 [Oscillospiraceae bacterium]|nr:hypothetical protein [Oscillospiraceae bacterium]